MLSLRHICLNLLINFFNGDTMIMLYILIAIFCGEYYTYNYGA